MTVQWLGQPASVGQFPNLQTIGPIAPRLVSPPPAPQALPWLRFSSATVRLQRYLNARFLRPRGLQVIIEDGIMGPQMCGAMRYIDQSFGSRWMQLYGARCREFRYPVPLTIFPTVVSGFPGQLGQIPANCWDMPGFKDCHLRQLNRSKEECTAGFIPEMTAEDIDACVRAATQRYTEEECVPQICPPAEVVGIQWLKYSSATKTLQQQTNATIRERRAAEAGYGLCEIEADGILGPITCNVINQAAPATLPPACNQNRARWEGTPLPLCGPQGAVDCPEGQVKTPAGCADFVPPPPPECPAGQQREPNTGQCIPVPAPPAAAAAAGGGIGAGGLALLAAAALGAVYLVTQAT